MAEENFKHYGCILISVLKQAGFFFCVLVLNTNNIPAHQFLLLCAVSAISGCHEVSYHRGARDYFMMLRFALGDKNPIIHCRIN